MIRHVKSSKTSLPEYACKECGKRFKPQRRTSKYCSRRCSWDNNGGHNRKLETWWKNPKGYIEGRITLPDGSRLRVKKHRWIIENQIGRRLRRDEVVHHKNGDKTDNRIENLELMSYGNHSALHNLERVYKRGYKLNLTPQERARRRDLAKTSKLWVSGQAALAIAKATGGTPL